MSNVSRFTQPVIAQPPGRATVDDASSANVLAQRFQSTTFAHWFFRLAALAMVISAGFAVYLTWAATGR